MSATSAKRKVIKLENKRNLRRIAFAKSEHSTHSLTLELGAGNFVPLIVFALAVLMAPMEYGMAAETSRNAKTAQVPPREGVVSQREE